MKLLALIHEHTPEPVKVVVAALTFCGVSVSDINVLIQIAVGIATFTYITTKTVKMWRKKGKE